MRNRVVQLAYILLPFGFLSLGTLHIGQRYAFLITALVVIAFWVENLFIRGFLVYTSAWTLFVLIKAMGNPEYNLLAGLSFSMIWFFTAGAVLYLAVVHSKLKSESFYNLICIGAIIQSALALCQLCGYDPVLYLLSHNLHIRHTLPHEAVIGTLYNNNFLAAYLAVSLVFFYRKKWCWFVPVIVLILAVSKTSAAVIPAIIGSGIYYWSKLDRFKIEMFGIAFCLCIVYAIYDGSIFKNIRYQWWINSLKLLNSPPKLLFGLSPGFEYGKCPVHNEWVSILCKYGIVGLCLVIGYCLTIYRNNRMLFSAFIVVCINMFGNYPLHLAPSGFLIIVIVGLIEKERKCVNI